jgi:hypothetical protein
LLIVDKHYKIMKKNLLFLFLILCPLVFTSCVDDDNFDETEAILGDWVGTNNNMGFNTDERGYLNPNSGNGNIDDLLYDYGCVLEGTTYIDYRIDTYNQLLDIAVTNVNPDNESDVLSTYNVSIPYYFEDYDHIVLDNQYEFERYIY